MRIEIATLLFLITAPLYAQDQEIKNSMRARPASASTQSMSERL